MSSLLQQQQPPQQQQQQQVQCHPQYGVVLLPLPTIRNVTLLFSFVIGMFYQLTTFATSFISSIHLDGETAEKDKDNNTNKTEYYSYGMWFLIVGMGLIGLWSFRYLMQKYIIIAVSSSKSSSSSEHEPSSALSPKNNSNNNHHQLLMDYVDQNLALGSFLGASLTWFFTDILLLGGEGLNLRHSVPVVLLLFVLIKGTRMSSNLVLSQHNKKEREEEEQNPAKEGLLVSIVV